MVRHHLLSNKKTFTQIFYLSICSTTFLTFLINTFDILKMMMMNISHKQMNHVVKKTLEKVAHGDCAFCPQACGARLPRGETKAGCWE